MARKELVYTVTEEGRDKGKQYVLREMPASRAEAWAVRAFLALARSGVEIPENVKDMGIIGIAQIGLKSLGGCSAAEVLPLLDELMECVQAMPDPQKPEIIRSLIESDIEEVQTRVLLKREVFDLHTDFFSTADRLTSQGQ